MRIVFAANIAMCFDTRMPQLAGESPIDNLQLPNLMRQKDALLVTVGRRNLQQGWLSRVRAAAVCKREFPY